MAGHAFRFPDFPEPEDGVPVSPAHTGSDLFDATAEVFVRQWADGFMERTIGKRLRISHESERAELAEDRPVAQGRMEDPAANFTPNQSMEAVYQDLQGAMAELNTILNVIKLIKPPQNAAMQRPGSLPSPAATPTDATPGITYLFDRTTVVGPQPPPAWYARQTMRARGRRSLQLEVAAGALSSAAARLTETLPQDRLFEGEVRQLVHEGWCLQSRMALAHEFVQAGMEYGASLCASPNDICLAIDTIAASVAVESPSATVYVTALEPFTFPPCLPCPISSLSECMSLPNVMETTHRLAQALAPHLYASVLPSWFKHDFAARLRLHFGMATQAVVLPTKDLVNAVPPRSLGTAHTDALAARRVAQRFGVMPSIVEYDRLPAVVIACPAGFKASSIHLSFQKAGHTPTECLVSFSGFLHVGTLHASEDEDMSRSVLASVVHHLDSELRRVCVDSTTFRPLTWSPSASSILNIAGGLLASYIFTQAKFHALSPTAQPSEVGDDDIGSLFCVSVIRAIHGIVGEYAVSTSASLTGDAIHFDCNEAECRVTATLMVHT
jgi:hypothetical protein